MYDMVRSSLMSETLDRISSCTKLINKVTDVCYEEQNANWEHDSTTDNEGGERRTDDTESTSETD